MSVWIAVDDDQELLEAVSSVDQVLDPVRCEDAAARQFPDDGVDGKVRWYGHGHDRGARVYPSS